MYIFLTHFIILHLIYTYFKSQIHISNHKQLQLSNHQSHMKITNQIQKTVVSKSRIPDLIVMDPLVIAHKLSKIRDLKISI